MRDVHPGSGSPFRILMFYPSRISDPRSRGQFSCQEANTLMSPFARLVTGQQTQAMEPLNRGQILSPWLGDIVDSGIYLSYRPASLCSLVVGQPYAGVNDINPSQALSILLHDVIRLSTLRLRLFFFSIYLYCNDYVQAGVGAGLEDSHLHRWTGSGQENHQGCSGRVILVHDTPPRCCCST